MAIVADEPLFDTGLLLAGAEDPRAVRQQLSRWVRSGKVQQLKRGLYALAPPWQRCRPHPFLLANRLTPGSYVSGLSALAFNHVIPEYVAEVTSMTGGRPHCRDFPSRRFSYRHLKASLMFGYRLVDLGDGQQAFVASDEKALLDAVYLEPGGDELPYLEELRLNFETLDLDALVQLAERSAAPKLVRAAGHVSDLADVAGGYRAL